MLYFNSESQGISIPVAVWLPKDHSKNRDWPVMLFLHGAGERGRDGFMQAEVGIGPALRRFPERFPMVVVMPQCPSAMSWSRLHNQMIKSIETALLQYHGDPNRVLLSGVSMGGYGTWELASRHPNRFSAIIPICGGGEPKEMARSLANIPIWAFHGALDEIVPPSESRNMINAIRSSGGIDVRYTEYPDVAHESWDRAYSDPDLPRWMLSKSRSANRIGA
jgi:predicted peptidase